MKVKTNLTPKELELVAKGLNKLAQAQTCYEPLKAENPAEQVLLHTPTDAFHQMLTFIQEDLEKLASR